MRNDEPVICRLKCIKGLLPRLSESSNACEELSDAIYHNAAHREHGGSSFRRSAPVVNSTISQSVNNWRRFYPDKSMDLEVNDLVLLSILIL